MPNGAAPQPDKACGWVRLAAEVWGSGRWDLDRGRRVGHGYVNRLERLVGLLAPVRPEPLMTLPRTVADVLSRHVRFEIECIDRMYLNVYQPRLQHPAGVARVWIMLRVRRPRGLGT